MTAFADRLLPADAPDVLRQVVAYWDTKRGGRRMPAFADIDPTEIPLALSRLYILRVVPDGEFVYRLAGTEIERPYGRSLKGTRISDLYPLESAATIQARWTRVAREPACCFTNTEHPSPHQTFIAAQRVTMPLGDDGDIADHVMGIAFFGPVVWNDKAIERGATIRNVTWINLETDEISAETPTPDP